MATLCTPLYSVPATVWAARPGWRARLVPFLPQASAEQSTIHFSLPRAWSVQPLRPQSEATPVPRLSARLSSLLLGRCIILILPAISQAHPRPRPSACNPSRRPRRQYPASCVTLAWTRSETTPPTIEPTWPRRCLSVCLSRSDRVALCSVLYSALCSALLYSIHTVLHTTSTTSTTTPAADTYRPRPPPPPAKLPASTGLLRLRLLSTPPLLHRSIHHHLLSEASTRFHHLSPLLTLAFS